MTVSTSTAKAGPYAGAGSAGPFTVPFRFLDASHLRVIRTSTAGVDSTLVLTTDYTVSGVGAASGSVTLTTALATGEKLTVVRSVPFTQEADYVNNDAFPAESHETALDKLTMQTQQLKERVDSALTLPPTVSGVSAELPAPSAGDVIGWNGNASGLTNISKSELVTIAAYGTVQADIFTGTGAQTVFTLTANPGAQSNLDVSISGVTQLPGVDYTWTSGTTLTFTSAPPNGAKVLARYGQVLPSGGGTSAPSSADLISYDPLLTYAAGNVGAELRTAQAQAEHFWRAVRNNQRDVYLIVTGDSTGNEATEWVYLMAQWLATQCPTHTIKYRLFNDGTTSWDSYTTLQTGSGPALPFTSTPFTIHIDNGSVSGTNTFYTQGGRESAFWTGVDYDLAIVNYGHNLGTGQTEEIAVPEWVMALSHVRLMAPRAGMLVTLQNPRSSSSSDINTNGSAASARMVAAWRKAVELVGAGVIDVYTAFRTHPDYPSLMADETHPTPAGSAVWLAEVKRVMAEPVRYTGDAPLGYNPLAEARPNYAPNPRFATWTAATPAGWEFTNCTPSKDTGRTDGSLYSMKVTIGAGANPRIRADLSNYIKHLAGKTVTMVARIWRPTGLDLLTGRIAIASTNNVSSSGSFISYPRGTPSTGGWEYVVSTYTIPRNHTQLTLDIYAGAAGGGDSGKFFHVDSVWFGTGWLPGVASLETVTDKFVPDFYNDGNVGLIPANTTGTVTAVGGVITLTGSTSPNAGAYIDLPGLTAGVTYTVSFRPVSCTGNTAGGVYARNGFGGGFTDITKASGTGDWVAGGSVVTFTFVAPNGPVSLWPYGYTGATGWVLDQWSITPAAAAGATVPTNVPIQTWRNNVGEVLTNSVPTNSFAITQTNGTASYLQGEAAQGNTKTGAATCEVMLPSTYVAGTNLSVVVNCNHTGTGTAGTRTMTVQAYRIANAGTHGSNIGPAAQTISGTATDYTFSVTGTSLSPGDRVLLRLSLALQETGGTNSLTGRVNSIRIS